jgi:hypothetical protein
MSKVFQEKVGRWKMKTAKRTGEPEIFWKFLESTPGLSPGEERTDFVETEMQFDAHLDVSADLLASLGFSASLKANLMSRKMEQHEKKCKGPMQPRRYYQ